MGIYKDIMRGLGPKIAFLSGMFLLAYLVPLKAMVTTWLTDGDYSYGFFIPLVSAYLVWDLRGRLRNVDVKNSWMVLPVLIVLVLISIYGLLGSSGNVSMPSVPLLIIAFTAFCFGLSVAYTMILPLGFLFFMVPIPAVLERTIGMYLKSISSRLGGEIIQAFNIPVHISGNIIDLGVTQLQVVDACNGLRYVFPLFALGIIYAFFFERVAWKRVICVLATIPIAILTNAVRIGMTGILTTYYGEGVAEGFMHSFSGWAMFWVAFAVLFLLGRVLAFCTPRIDRSTASEQFNIIPPDTKDIAVNPSINKGFVTSIVILAIVAGLSFSTKSLPPIRLKGGIASFPLTFSGWVGQAQLVSKEIIDESGAEEAFNASYRKSGDNVVSLYIGYRGTAFMAVENFFHSPTVCLPSSGWQVESTSTHMLGNVPVWGKLRVTRMIVSNMGDEAVVYFWFQTKDKHSHDKNINRFDLAMHAIKRDNTYDMFIRTTVYLQPKETVEEGEGRMDVFVRDTIAAMDKFVKANQMK